MRQAVRDYKFSLSLQIRMHAISLTYFSLGLKGGKQIHKVSETILVKSMRADSSSFNSTYFKKYYVLRTLAAEWVLLE